MSSVQLVGNKLSPQTPLRYIDCPLTIRLFLESRIKNLDMFTAYNYFVNNFLNKNLMLGGRSLVKKMV